MDGLLGRGIYLGPILEDLITFSYSNGANIPNPPNFTRPSRARSSLQFRIPTLPKSFHFYFFIIPQYFFIVLVQTVSHPQNTIYLPSGPP